MVRKILAHCAAVAAWIALAVQAASVAAAPNEVDKHSKAARSLTITFKRSENSRSFSVYDGSKNMILFQATINGHVTSGIIDTGSDVTIIDNSLLKRIGVREKKTDVNAQGIGGKFNILATDIVRIAFEGQFQADGEFFSSDLQGISKQLDSEIGVIIGMDILSNMAMAVDSKTSSIAFSPPEKMRTKDQRAILIKLNGRSLDGEIDGVGASIVFDTGSSAPFSVVSEKWDKFFRQNETVYLGTGLDVSGRRTSREGVKKASVALPGFSFETIVLKIDQLGVDQDAYLGYPILNVGTFIFNYPKQTIIIVPER